MYFRYLILWAVAACGQNMPNTNKIAEYLMNEGSGTTLTNNYCGNLTAGDCYNLTLDSAAGWSSQWYDFGQGAGTHRATVTGANAITLAHATVYAVVKWTRSPVLAGYAPILGDNGYGLQLFGLQNGGHDGNPSFNLNSSGQFSSPSNVDDGRWHCLAGSYDGTNTTVYIDGIVVRSLAVSIASSSISTLAMSYFSSSAYWPGLIAYAALYNEGHSASTIKTNCMSNIALWVMSAKGIVIPNLGQYIMFEGDSLTDQETVQAPGYATLAPYAISPAIQGWNIAKSGGTVASATTQASAVDTTFASLSNPKTMVLSVFLGANGVGSGGAAFVAALKTYCLARKAATPGLKIMVEAVLPQTTSGFNTQRNIANAAIASDMSFYDYFVRWDTDPTIGCDACASNANYFYDGEHLTAAAQAIAAPYVTAGMQTLFGLIGDPALRGVVSIRGTVTLR